MQRSPAGREQLAGQRPVADLPRRCNGPIPGAGSFPVGHVWVTQLAPNWRLAPSGGMPSRPMPAPTERRDGDSDETLAPRRCHRDVSICRSLGHLVTFSSRLGRRLVTFTPCMASASAPARVRSPPARPRPR
jgi:hypothetical protein